MEILKYGNPILKMRCDSISIDEAEEANKLLKKMVDIMHESRGVGLAAPQVGISKRMIVIDLYEEPENIYKIINPKIVWKSEEIVEFSEGCLSIPGIYEKVKRPASVSVEYFNEKFESCFIDHATGLFSSCLQHEIDHLDGKLYIDRLSRIKRARTINKFKKLQEQINFKENDDIVDEE
ncbi:MAG: peptide deformylase [Alphaproteobacteria bacterium]|nr:peptide deformylase [Alphaproteobacteria bacterium]